MSALARTNSHTKNRQYKEYVSFLDNYRTGKKDDQSSVTSDSGVNFSLTNSSNNSSNSVFSDVSDSAYKNGFKEHFENLNNRNNTPVNMEISKPNQKKQIVKSEVFIEIKNPPVSKNYATKMFEVQNIDKPDEVTISVSDAAKIFEKDVQVSINSLQSKQSFSKKSSIGEISKKFEDSSRTQKTNKSPPKRAASIGEVSKIFETGNSNNEGIRKPKNFNRVPRPFQATTLPRLTTEAKVSQPSSKPIISPKPVFSAPQFPKFTQEPIGHHHDNVDSAFSSLSISPSPPQSVSPPPILHLTASSKFSSPPPPPLPPSNFVSKPTLGGPVKILSSQNVIPAPALFSIPSSGPTSPPPPPPPPLPSGNFESKSALNRAAKPPHSQNGITSQQANQNRIASPQPVRNGAITQKIAVQTNEVPSQQNGVTINKNDPRMKKAVYGALRNMYGAYHDQANDYLATLPKNRVKKNNGLDDIINSIASQGGLDKLNGRANPGQDVE